MEEIVTRSRGTMLDVIVRLHRPYEVARAARSQLGGGQQDMKTIEECQELIEALAQSPTLNEQSAALQASLARLSRILSQRATSYKNGGARGQVDEETADVLLTLLGHIAEEGSPILDILDAKAERLAKRLEAGRNG
jgi:NTP pyrophosphatase (non-canonical NTP hydrolase)